MGSQLNMARMPIGKTDLKLETSKLDPKQRQKKEPEKYEGGKLINNPKLDKHNNFEQQISK